jgi:chaperonin GroES
MFEKMQPIGTRVLVRLIKEEQKTSSGLFLAPEYEEDSRIGEVLAVGNGKQLHDRVITPELKLGAKVYLPERGGLALTEDLVIFKEEEILGFWN